ncbi:MAG: hypothetical protein KBT48_10260 [Firmicutes bacterium]|nr:hypothetical protein [Bacillota bacterium]
MKRLNTLNKIITSAFLSLSLFACAPSPSSITEEDVLEALQYYEENSKPLQMEKDNPNEITFDEDGMYLQLFTITPDSYGTYEFSLKDYKKTKDVDLCLSVLDDVPNYLLTLYGNRKEDKGSVDLQGDTTYYVALFANLNNKKKTDSFHYNIQVHKVDDDIEEDAFEGKLTKKVKPNEYNAACFEPKEDGYYTITIDADSKDGDANIYAVATDEEEIYLKEGLCWLEKGTRYHIIYGVEDVNTKQTKITLQCTPLVENIYEEHMEISTDTAIPYESQEDGDILVYSLSSADPGIEIYNDEYEIIAQNNDYEGEYSTNNKDFATIFHVEKGKKYYIYIYNLKDEKCEIFFDAYVK